MRKKHWWHLLNHCEMKVFFAVFISIAGIFAPVIAQTLPQFVSGTIQFKIKNMGFIVNGTMGINSIQLKQTSADPTTWSIEGSGDPATISTGINLRDEHLKRADYFDAGNYPAIYLQSTAIATKGKNNYEGKFNLTIKAITKVIIIPFTIIKNNQSINIEAEFIINRLDYKLGEESSVLANDVKIKVSALFKIL
jgi:polyisoprenoid-binding protein YceI